VYTVLGATILRRHSPLVTTTWSVVAGTLFMIPVGLAQLVTVDPSTIGPSVIFAVAYAGLLAAGFANVIVLNGVKLLGPTRVSALQILVPALAVVLAAIFLDEQIRPIQVVGGVVILAGLALVRRGAWPGRTVREIVPVSEPGP
jgi:probable blue pigment (indigoidine) exporter